MSIFIEVETPVIVQGITGREGRFHTLQMIDYGTNIVGGVTPGKGGEWVAGKPVFDTVRAAVAATGATASVIFVPPLYAVDAIHEAADAGIELIVCITEGIPALDMMKVYRYIRKQPIQLIGPNSPGILIPSVGKLGIMPGHIASKGSVGVVSKSGTLMYEVVDALTHIGLGQSACVGIGADPVVGTTLVDVLRIFEGDPETDRVTLLGEIGGRAEIEAAEYIKTRMTKPVAAFIAGESAPPDTRMGHAGAIIEGSEATARVKKKALQGAGVLVTENPEEIPNLLKHL